MSSYNDVTPVLKMIARKTNAALSSGIRISLVPANPFLVSATPFDAKPAHWFSISKYVHRIQSYLKCDESIYAAALIYIDRTVSKNHWFVVSYRNVHK